MSADFPLITDLPLEDQKEIARIQAIDEAKRTASEAAYLDAREEYLSNVELSFRMRRGIRNPNAQNATAILHFSGDASDGEIVTIGADVYEFDEDDDFEEGNIQVDISGGASSVEAVSMLATAMGGQGTEEVDASTDGADFFIRSLLPGPTGDGSIMVSTTCLNAEWNSAVLSGGQYAVLANEAEFFWDSSSLMLYFAISDITDPTSNGSWGEAINLD